MSLTHLEVHPRQRLAAQHLGDAHALGRHKGGKVDQQRDAALLALGLALRVAEALDGLGADQTSVRVHDDNHLPALVRQRLDLGAHGRGIVEKALVGRLGTDRGIRYGASVVFLGVQPVLDELVAVGRVPGAWRQDEDGAFRGGGHGR